MSNVSGETSCRRPGLRHVWLSYGLENTGLVAATVRYAALLGVTGVVVQAGAQGGRARRASRANSRIPQE